MKKILWMSVGAMAVVVLSARAVEAAAASSNPEKTRTAYASATWSAGRPVSQEVTITGTLSKSYPCACVHVATYTLTRADGTSIKLPRAKSPIRLDDFVGATVKVTGVGGERTINGKRTLVIQQIAAVEKLPGRV